MAKRTLDDLIAEAVAADAPRLVAECGIAHSSIDPCGLRETNFDMMNQVCDGLNNVARHIRPFTLVAWAWRRALRLAEAEGNGSVEVSVLDDFVARCEVIFAWSLFLADRTVDLPGGQALLPIIRSESYDFGGPAWISFRENRRYSTALSAPVNYGPALKSLGWLVRNARNPQVLNPAPQAMEALDAFERLIADRLDHPAFSGFGPATVTSAEALEWAPAWALGNLTDEERRHAARTLAGDLATPSRASGITVLVTAAAQPDLPPASDPAGHQAVIGARNTAAGEDGGFIVPAGMEHAAARWRTLQFRQLFRYSIEALLAWSLDRLSDGPMDTGHLVAAFLNETGMDGNSPAGTEWLATADSAGKPSEAISRISAALGDKTREGLARAISDGMALCLANAPDSPKAYDRPDRLPLRLAARQAEARRNAPVRELVRHVIETWTFAQHVYWSIGRGLQDARSNSSKTILRLKLLMEEGGWTALPGRGRMTPEPTPDRIRTALSLASESGLLVARAA
jgi:hypothetical protein